MQEQRRAVRYQISFYLRIFNKTTNEAIGHVVDMSATGMKILADRPVAVDTEYTLFVDLKTATNFKPEVMFSARCVWVREDPMSGAYNCGFHLVNVTEEQQDIINRLIEQFGDQVE